MRVKFYKINWSVSGGGREKTKDCFYKHIWETIGVCVPQRRRSNSTWVKIFSHSQDLNIINSKFLLVFIAEKGPECFTDKQEHISHCINATFHNYMPKETPSLENLPNLLLTEKECKDMDKLQICIVKELEQCEESTPANLVESLFKFIKNETPCSNHTSITSANPNSSEIHKLSFNVLLGTWLMALLAKLLITQ